MRHQSPRNKNPLYGISFYQCTGILHIGSCNTTENVAYSLVFLLEGGGTSSAKCKILH